MKNIVLLAAMLLIGIAAAAQTDPTVTTYERTWSKNMNLQIGFDPLLAYTSIYDKDQAQDNTITKSGSVQVHFGFDGGLFFNKYIGIGSGLYYAAYGDSWTWNLPYTQYGLTDSYGNSYSETYSGNVSTKQRMTYLEVPFVLRIGDNTFDKVGFYINPGIVVSLLASAQKDVSGIVTVTDNYTASGNTTSNVYDVGSSSSSKNDLTKVLLLTTISCGISIPLNEEFKANIGLNYEHSLTDIFVPDVRGTYYQLDGTTKPYAPNKPYSIGLEVSLHYKFR